MADEADDLDYSENNVGLAQAQGVRKNISLKLKAKGRGRGRRGGKVRRGASKKVIEDVTEETTEEVEQVVSEKQLVDSNLEDVISKLETPAFSPMDRTFPEPLHQNKKLRWDHKVNLIGEKVIDPLIHCCEKCSLPILNYGRMIPCKHVFCYDCAKKAEKVCPKCDEKIQRTEPSALGTVFMCTFGGTRHSPGACGRTYLSQRDLQAHINHRHMKPSSAAPVVSTAGSHPITASTASTGVQGGHMNIARDPRDPRAHLQVDVSSHQTIIMREPPVDHARGTASISMGSPAGSGQSRQYPPHSPASYPSTIPVSSARPNLITVPIQDDGISGTAVSHMHPQTHVPTYAPNAAPMPAAIQQQHPGAPAAYTPHAYQHATSAYSQAPPITTLTFSQPPPPVHHQPPQMHQPGAGAGTPAPMYSNPPLPPHHQPPGTYTGPPRNPAPRQPMHALPPQRFHEEGAAPYMPPQWGGPPGGNVPPPPARASLPPRPITAPPPPSAANPNVGMLQPRGPPTEGAYRQPYYQ